MVIESKQPPARAEHLDDPAFIRAFVEAQSRRDQWQASVDQLVRDMLGLRADEALDPASVPSAAEIRAEISRNVPQDEKLSDMVVAMREESG